METVAVKSLVDGQTHPAESIHIHNVVAEVVEEEIVREVGHNLRQKKLSFEKLVLTIPNKISVQRNQLISNELVQKFSGLICE